MADNWIERRAAREKNLEGAIEVWQRAVTAIDNACNSYKANYSDLGSTELLQENGHRIIVAVKHASGGKRRHASIIFDDAKPHISVAIDEGSAKHFRIEADETHCFIKSPAGKEISADEFSQIALEDVLFKRPSASSRPSGGTSKSTAWS